MDRGVRVALIFTLVAEQLTARYEREQWLTVAQGASLIAEWLARTKRHMPVAERKQLSELSDRLARQIAAPLSREAGLYIAHEMMEALDPNYHSETGLMLMQECERMLDSQMAEQPPENPDDNARNTPRNS